MRDVKILFSSDLHGSTLCFEKLLSCAVGNKVDALLIGGDISGKTLTPVLELGAGKFQAAVGGVERVVGAGRELRALEEDVAASGSYPLRVSREEFLDLERDETLRHARFLDRMMRRLERWLWLAERRLKDEGIRLIVMCGNDDDWELDKVLEASSFTENPDGQVVDLEGHEIIGESGANPTPFKCPRDMSEIQLKRRISKKIAGLRAPQEAILLFHVPPFSSSLDNAYKLSADLEVVAKGGHPVMEPVGSHAVREAIEEVKPLLSLHGHIHESPGFVKIGRTLCVNVGSEYWAGIMRAALITLDKTRVLGYMAISY